MTARVFYSKGSLHHKPASLLPLFREAVALLLPNTISIDWPDASLKSPQSFLLREGENVFWVEVTSSLFTRNEITDYLDRARKIQSVTPLNLCGILAAPDFETGIRELLELIRIPVRLFRYREAVPLGVPPSFQEPVLCIEEISVFSEKPSVYPPQAEIPIEPLSVGPGSPRSRLGREELREFIQLELDMASRLAVHK